MEGDDAQLDKLAGFVRKLEERVAYHDGEIKRLSSDVSRMEARQQAISEMIEDAKQH